MFVISICCRIRLIQTCFLSLIISPFLFLSLSFFTRLFILFFRLFFSFYLFIFYFFILGGGGSCLSCFLSCAICVQLFLKKMFYLSSVFVVVLSFLLSALTFFFVYFCLFL